MDQVGTLSPRFQGYGSDSQSEVALLGKSRIQPEIRPFPSEKNQTLPNYDSLQTTNLSLMKMLEGFPKA